MQFENLKINENIMKAIQELGYVAMTPIQEQSLPIVLEGRDIIAQAPTGTGKTACFAIPAIERINVDNRDVQVLILCPTRELAMQVTGEIKKLAQFSKGVKVITVYGGQSIDVQIKGLKNRPQIVVGTPGRVMDHMRRGTLSIANISMLVLDEADEMLNMGFKEDLDTILQGVSSPHQTLLFSATVPDEIKRITKEYQHEAFFVRTTYNETAVPSIEQFYVELLESNKTDCLSRMIDTYNFKQALVFCRTKKKVDDVSLALTSRGYAVESLHGDLKQAGREKVMEMFREGLVRVLIATDVAARGLDIEGIDVVFNYDIPDDVEYYIHRIGRTARAGRTGSAYTFVTKRELSRLKSFEKQTKTPIIKIAPPTYQMAEASKVRHTLKDLMSAMVNMELKTYQDYIETALIEADMAVEPIEIAAAFLKQIVDKESKYKDTGLNLDVEETKKGKKSPTPDDFDRLFINLGRKDELTKGELLDLVRTKRHVDKADIKNIDIMNTFSFFEIPKAKTDLVIKTLSGMDYNGRRIDVEVAIGKGDKKEKAEDKRKIKKSSFKSSGGEIKKHKKAVTKFDAYQSKKREKSRPSTPDKKSSKKRVDISW